MSESNLPSVPAPQGPGHIAITGRGLLEGLPVPTLIADRPTNIDLSTDSGKVAYINAQGVADYNGDDALDVPIALTRYIVMPADAVDEESGEIRLYPRIVLITSSGESYGFSSEVVLRRLASLIAVFGPGPWVPAINVVVSARKGKRSGRTYHDLKIAPMEVRNETEQPTEPRKRGK